LNTIKKTCLIETRLTPTVFRKIFIRNIKRRVELERNNKDLSLFKY